MQILSRSLKKLCFGWEIYATILLLGFGPAFAGRAVAQSNSSVKASGAQKRFPVTDSGAIGDGKTLNTKAIQAAIDLCVTQGGGTVTVPAGVFLTGSIFLMQGCGLEIEKDAVLKGTSNQEDYPQVKTRWEGIERMWTAALVNAQGVTDLAIGGAGTIDGSGDEWLLNAKTAAVRPSGPRLGRPRLIAVENSRRVRVSDLKLKNQAVWCLHILYSEDVTIDNLTIRAAHDIPSSDGIDIDSSRRVRVRRCDIDVNDDCISIKSGRDADGLRVNRPSENITIENCRFGYGHGGVAMGSETSGGIRNVMVRNNVAEDGNWAPVRFKTQPSRGGIVENIVFKNFRLNNVGRAFEINMEWTSARGTLAPPAKALPVFRRIRLINVSGTSRSGGLIRGLAESPVQDLKFKNCRVSARESLSVEHARRVDFKGLKLTVEKGDSIIRKDVE